jgi:hypothetical protein
VQSSLPLTTLRAYRASSIGPRSNPKTKTMSQRAVEQAIGRGAGESSAAAFPPPARKAVVANVDRDADLVEALRLGEAAAVERLVVTYGDRAYRLAVRITGNAQDAEEAVQDAFWSVVRKIGAFRGDAAFRSWLDRSLDDVLAFVDAESRHDASIAD